MCAAAQAADMKECPICGIYSRVRLMEDGVQLAWYCTICSTAFGGAEFGWGEWEPTVPKGWTTSAVVRP